MRDPHVTQPDILKLVVRAVRTVAPDVTAIGAETPLIGNDAVLDSVGFVTLLVGLEQDLGDALDLASSFMAQNEASEIANPFRTVGSLAEHILRLLSTRAETR